MYTDTVHVHRHCICIDTTLTDTVCTQTLYEHRHCTYTDAAYVLYISGECYQVTVQFTLEQCTEAQRSSRGIAILLL